MSIRTHLLSTIAAAVVALAGFAATAAASDSTPPPPGAPPAVPGLDAGATLTLPRGARPGRAATVALRPAGPAPAGLRADRITCLFRLGTRTLPSTVKVVAGAATCTVRVPRSAAGKTVRGAMRVVLDHIALNRSFSFRIARA